MPLTKNKNLVISIAVSTALLSSCGGGSSNNSQAEPFLIELGRFETGQFDESAAEILSFDPVTDRLFVVNAQSGTVDVLDISDPNAPVLDNAQIDFAAFDAANAGFARGDVNSVDVNSTAHVIAVAVASDSDTSTGRVAFFNTDTLALISSVEVGVLPDSLVFTNNGNAVLVANEGEPAPIVNVTDPANPFFDPFTTANDPEGSISVINVTSGFASPSVSTVTFDDTTLNSVLGNPTDLQNFLRMSGVALVGNGETLVLDPVSGPVDPSQLPQLVSIAADLEPEFVAVSPDDQTAWVVLQENNAVAVVDISDVSAPTLVSIRSFGAKDFSVEGNELDLSNRDGEDDGAAINIRRWPVFGMYRPDTIASYSVNGNTYFVTANEGDAREIEDEVDDPNNPGEEIDVAQGELIRGDDVTLDPIVFDPTTIANTLGAFEGDLQDDANLGRIELTVAFGDTDGDAEHEQLFAFGARSFSIWSSTLPTSSVDPASTATFNPAVAGTNAIAGGLAQVFDSGSDFEDITSERFGINFNNTNDENEPENRSDDAGPEPEALAVGEIDGRYYAFIGLERVGGIMVYDITDPAAPVFEEYANDRNFDTSLDPSTGDDIGDLGPEGIEFISAEDSPIDEPMIAVSNEVSGTTTLYRVNVDN